MYIHDIDTQDLINLLQYGQNTSDFSIISNIRLSKDSSNFSPDHPSLYQSLEDRFSLDENLPSGKSYLGLSQ